MAEIPVGSLEELLNNPELKEQAEAAGKSVRAFLQDNPDAAKAAQAAPAPSAEAPAPASDPSAPSSVQDAVSRARPSSGATGDWGPPSPPDAVPDASPSKWKKPAAAAAGGVAAGAGMYAASQPGADAAPPASPPPGPAPTLADAVKRPVAPAAETPAAPTKGPRPTPTTQQPAPVSPIQPVKEDGSIPPGAASAATQRLNRELRTQIDSNDQRVIQPKLDALQDLQAAYRAEYAKATDRTQLAELGEKLGHAFAQMGAGIQGLKTNVDMSTGLKFDKTDWSKRYETQLNKLRDDLQDVRDQRTQVDQNKREYDTNATRMAERAETSEVRDITSQERSKERTTDQATENKFKAGEGAANRKNALDIANVRADALGSRGGAGSSKLSPEDKKTQDISSGLASMQEAWDMQDSDDKATKQKGVAAEAKAAALLGRYVSPQELAAAKAARKEPGFFQHPLSWLQSDSESRNADAMNKLQGSAQKVAPKAPAPPAGKVTVTSTENGKKYLLDKDAADAAVQSGKAKY